MNRAENTADWRAVWKRQRLGPAINRHPDIVFQAAQILVGRGEVRAAEAAFTEVLERDPQHVAALTWLANLLQNRGRHAEAAVYVERRQEIEAALKESPGPQPATEESPS